MIPTPSVLERLRTKRRKAAIGACALAAFLAPMYSLSAQDGVTVGSLETSLQPGQKVSLPLYVRDVSGTLLDTNAGNGRKIQQFSVTLEITPVTAVSMVKVKPAGIATSLATRFQHEMTLGNRHSWIASFDVAQAPLPFNVDAAEPGDQVAEIELQLSNLVGPTTVVEVGLAGATTALGNQFGSFGESTDNGHLSLTGGAAGPVGIFADGFESGNTTRWSRALP